MIEPEFSNGLTSGEEERLAILSEECGEVIQAIGKILRHGYESTNNGANAVSNRGKLAQEMGQLRWTISWLAEENDIDPGVLDQQFRLRQERIRPYLHHNKV